MRIQTVSYACGVLLIGAAGLMCGCGAPPAATNNSSFSVNTNANAASTNSGVVANSSPSSTTDINAREPDVYQATVTLKVQTLGAQQNVAAPTLSAKVARNATDRRMEFTMPAGGRVVYLDKGENKYLVLPDKNQYAELNSNSTGFDIRRMMTPGEIVKQVKAQQGLQLVGDDTFNGRPVTKYRYAAVTNTQSQAGKVDTESYLYVDKDTGLPLHSETTSQATGSVNGYNGVRVTLEMNDITTDAPADIFAVPTNMEKIQDEQVRAQVNGIFQALASVLTQLLQQGQTGAAPAPTATVAATPAG